MIVRASPNHNARPANIAVSVIVLHADASGTARASVDWCCKPESKVSYHVIIDRDGTVYKMVDVSRRAWHAGVSSFEGITDVNSHSIGLSFSNKNDGKEPYTERQIEVAAALCKGWMAQFPKITLDRITTHAIISPGRKTDPKGFDLAAFKAKVAA